MRRLLATAHAAYHFVICRAVGLQRSPEHGAQGSQKLACLNLPNLRVKTEPLTKCLGELCLILVRILLV